MPAAAPPIAEPKRPKAQAPAPAASSKAAQPPAPTSKPASPNSGQQRSDSMALRAKLAVGAPGDSLEQEADRVADQIMQGPRQAERGTTATQAAPAARQVQRTNAQGSTPGLVISDDLSQRIEAQRGMGQALPGLVQDDMKTHFGRDFSDVRIHTNGQAQALSAETQARAFTVGRDIFFAAGEFEPGSPSGKRLLAHELTHVVQQEQSGPRIQRIPPPAPLPAATTPAPPPVTVPSLRIPKFKFDSGRYQTATLIKAKEYNREGANATHQAHTWDTEVNAAATITKLRDTVGMNQPNHTYAVAANPRSAGSEPVGDAATIGRGLLRPWWTSTSAPRGIKHEVDHVIELQLSGWPRVRTADRLSNYELVDQDANSRSGGEIDRALVAAVGTAVPGTPPRDVMRSRDVLVTSVADSGTLANATRWTQAQIEAGAHIDTALAFGAGAKPVEFWDLDDPAAHGAFSALPARLSRENYTGSSSKLVIYMGSSGGSRSTLDFAAAPAGVASPTLTSPRGLFIHGFQVDQVTFNRTRANRADPVGVVRGRAFRQQAATGRVYTTQPVVDWTIRSMLSTDYAGYLDGRDLRNLISYQLNFMSPIQINNLTLDPTEGLVARSKVLPTLPLLRDADIDLVFAGDDMRLEKYFNTNELSLPAPLHLDTCSLGVSLGTTSGLRFSGDATFSIDRLGRGRFTGSAGTTGGTPAVSLEGQFDFDSALFDRATVQAWYREGQFGASGELGIDTPDKIRGIRSANLSVQFQSGQLNATGTVAPNIPGVNEGSLRLQYSEANGLLIGGGLQLAPNPAIRSGSIDVTVRKQQDLWRVAATGTAQPAIPGIDSSLTVSYDDGAFNASVRAAFARGMLSGTAEVGATNRSLDAQGQPTGAPEPAAPIVVYGQGSATLQIAPWLQGTAGIRFAPNGEVTVSGEIALPGQINLFDRREINKSLFSLSTQIPIVPGIVAEVGGSLSAKAGIGPGVLDQLRIGIEYNPAREDDTHVTGDAHLNVPGDAGLRLAARAGIGLGITGASATGGIELGGSLGIDGAAEAGVHVDWTPRQGLSIDAEAAFHAEPKFKFDVSGYVAVTALGLSVYDNRWELAAYELGSNLRFGVRFPVHYREGEPFSVSLDDVQFEVPEVDPGAMIGQLGERIF